MPEHGERVRGEDIGRRKGAWYIPLVCVDCEETRVVQWKSPPYPERCQECSIKRRAGLGVLTVPVSERKKFRRDW